MAFNFSPDLFKKAYGSSPLGDTGFAFGSSSGDLSGGAGKAGGGMTFPNPLTLGLGLANLGVSAWAVNKADRTRRDVANAQMRQAADQLEWKTALARESAKGGMATDTGNRVSSYTVAPDLEFGRQREAAMFAAGPLGERQLALDVERGRREIGLKGSAEAKELRRRENREALKRSVAEQEAQLARVFGLKAPVDVGTLAV